MLKQQLLGADGQKFFEEKVKDVFLPGGVIPGRDAFDGTLISSTPADHPNRFLIALPGNTIPEVTLKLLGKLEKPLSPGTPVTFEGVVRAFTADPFMLTFDVEGVNRAQIQ